MKTKTPAPFEGREELSKLGGADNTISTTNFKLIPTGKNRLLVLESIAEKWASRGLYQNNPTRAMAVLLGVSDE